MRNEQHQSRRRTSVVAQLRGLWPLGKGLREGRAADRVLCSARLNPPRSCSVRRCQAVGLTAVNVLG